MAERKSIFSLVLLNCGQNIIITCGLLAGGLLCAKRVSEGIYQVLYCTIVSRYHQTLTSVSLLIVSFTGRRLCPLHFLRPSTVSASQLLWHILQVPFYLTVDVQVKKIVLFAFRMIQQAFIDMENMFDLLEEKQEARFCYCGLCCNV